MSPAFEDLAIFELLDGLIFEALSTLDFLVSFEALSNLELAVIIN